MSEFIIISIVVASIILIVLMVALYLTFGNSMPTIFAAITSFSRDQEDLVNPDAEIIPNQERLSSDVLKDRGAQVKAYVPVVPQQAPILAYPQSDNSAKLSNLPYEAQTVQAPPTDIRPETGVYALPQELVQRSTILDAENPVTQSAPKNMNLK